MSTDTPSQQVTPDELADKCEAWLQFGGASNIVDAFEAGYRAALAASPQPTAAQPLKDEQAVAELVEALRALLDEQDAQQGYATPAAYGRARAALSRAPGAGMLNAKLNGAP